MNRLICGILCLILLFSFSGCGKSSSLIRYDISSAPKNLDPQFATSETDRMVIANLFEGLVRQLPNGQVVDALAESHTVSPDGKTYTFTLRQDAKWKNEEPVTADDFVFAFRRIFNSLSPSPYAQQFLSLKNAPNILSGSLDVSLLGVSAPDDRTVVFQLSQADASFLERLCHTSAMPCNQKFFEETRGKYGTTASDTPSNGPFFLNLWNEDRLYLKKNAHYRDNGSVKTPGVYLYIGRDQPSNGEESPPTLYELVMDEKSDSCPVTYQQAMDAISLGCTYEEQANTVWGLVANPDHQQLSNESIRKSFFHSINREELTGYLTENMVLTDRIIAPDVCLFTKPYTATTDLVSREYDPILAQEEREEGLSQLGINALNTMELLVPEDGNVPFLCGMLQQMWQRNLSAFVNIVALPQEELQNRVSAGDYDLAIMPFTTASNTPYDVLSRFTAQSAQNIWDYSNEAFDSLLIQTAASSEEDAVWQGYTQAESLLYEDCVVFPMFYEISYILFAPNVTGIEVYPYGGMVSFQNASAIR